MGKKSLLVGLLLAGVAGGADLGLLFQKGAYRQICQKRWQYIKLYRGRDEQLLSIVAYSCLKIGGITPALDLAKNLYKTPMGRENGSYISALFLIKKLLLQVIEDQRSLKNLTLPTVAGEELLVEFFNRVKGGQFSRQRGWVVTSDNRYRGRVTRNGNILIEKLDDAGNSIKKELYW